MPKKEIALIEATINELEHRLRYCSQRYSIPSEDANGYVERF